MGHGDFAIVSRRHGGEVVAEGGSLEEALARFNGHDPGRDIGFVVVEYHKYREIPLFECSSAEETRRKIRAKIGEARGRQLR